MDQNLGCADGRAINGKQLNASVLPRIEPMPLASLHTPFDHPDWIFELRSTASGGVAYVENGCHAHGVAFARERIQRLMGDRVRTGGPPPIAPDDPTGVQRFTRS